MVAVVALGAACPPAKPPAACDPQSCGGCCLGDTCMSGLSSAACGSSGVSCALCSASQSCRPGVGCEDPADGGSGGDGGTGDCDGCVLPDGTCVPLARTSVAQCGSGGASCGACFPGDLCTFGQCATNGSPNHVGEDCVADVQCERGVGSLSFCALTTSSGNATYPGGYCTFRCGRGSSPCPLGSSCVAVPAPYGEAEALCLDRCSPTDRCRTGYACYPFNGGSACWISPAPALDAGSRADKVGEPCADELDCLDPPASGGACLTREFNREWPGGYCSSENCITDAECSTDGGAFCFRLSSATACVRRCARDGGQADCRDGYECQDGFCAPPAAPIPSSIGDACVIDQDCRVPAGAIADCFVPVFADGGPSGFTDGYCTRFGCAGDDECSTDGGAICLSIGGSNTACFGRCPLAGSGRSTCRAGYACESYPLPDGGRSGDGLCDRSCAAAGAPACPAGQTCSPTSRLCQ
jgi:hypothetical protein